MDKRVDNRPTKVIFPEAQGIIDYCFTIGTIDYFQFSDISAVPNERGFQALSYYREYAMRCDRSYLLDHCKAFDTIINDNSKGVKLTELITLNNQMKERLELLHEPNIAFKLMGVVIFDSSENPNRFEGKKCIEKAEIFKECANKNLDFFLLQPIIKLIPCIDLLVSDFPEFCRVANLINVAHLETIFTILSDRKMSNEFYSKDELQRLKASV